MILVKAIHLHKDGTEFVLVAERQSDNVAVCRQFIMCVGFGERAYNIATAEGVVIVEHQHQGYGTYSLKPFANEIGSDNSALDPISAAVLAKGWSRDLIRFEYCNPYCRHGSFLLPSLPTSARWNGEKTAYRITPNVNGPLHWGIHVHLNDHGHIGFHVTVPHIYQDEAQLEAFLKAVATMPHASEMPDVHPAQLAQAS
jgi:hypothetical protein